MDGMGRRRTRQRITGELGAAKSCPPSSEGAGRRRTSAMEQRAVLRPYLDGMETLLKTAFPQRSGNLVNLARFADDFVRHEARTGHDARASAAGRRAASLSP
jgi:hypothetical protein